MFLYKYRRRIFWYFCLAMLMGVAFIFIHLFIAIAFLKALGIYFPSAIFFWIFNLITSNTCWPDMVFGLPASRFMKKIIVIGGFGMLLSILLDGRILVEILLLAILAAIDGLITEHEIRP